MCSYVQNNRRIKKLDFIYLKIINFKKLHNIYLYKMRNVKYKKIKMVTNLDYIEKIINLWSKTKERDSI